MPIPGPLQPTPAQRLPYPSAALAPDMPRYGLSYASHEPPCPCLRHAADMLQICHLTCRWDAGTLLDRLKRTPAKSGTSKFNLALPALSRQSTSAFRDRAADAHNPLRSNVPRICPNAGNPRKPPCPRNPPILPWDAHAAGNLARAAMRRAEPPGGASSPCCSTPCTTFRHFGFGVVLRWRGLAWWWSRSC